MKKIIMAIAIAVCATVASAASFDWKTSATGKIYEAGTTTVLASGTAYIFDSAAVSQQALVAAFIADGSLMSGSLHSKAITDGKITATAGEAFTWSGGDSLSAYIAVVAGDNIFISSIVTESALDTGYSALSFNAKSASQAAAIELKTGDSISGAGWYTAGSTGPVVPGPGGDVPEPTSGILLLLGMAGLALRRKRA